MEALSEGSSVEQANRQTGIASKREGDPLLVTVARAIGKAVGKVIG